MHQNYRWVGASVIGASHLRRSLPNQDAFRFEPVSASSWIAAVADGHGSSAHPRSHIGAQIAVDKAIELCIAYVDPAANLQSGDSQSVRDILIHELAKSICDSWQEETCRHFDKNPLQLELLESCHREGRESTIQELYGSTLAVAFSCGDKIFAFSIGDSEISIVHSEGLRVSLDIHRCDRFTREETDSICMKNAWLKSMASVYPVKDVASIFLHTDGITKSLADISDLVDLFRYYHRAAVTGAGSLDLESDMSQQLLELTTNGSGDDCTMLHVTTQHFTTL